MLFRQVIEALIISHSVFSIIYLLANKERPSIYLILTFFTLLIPPAGSVVSSHILHQPGGPWIVNSFYVALAVPFLYFYTRDILNLEKNSIKKNLLHIIPLALLFLAYVFFHPRHPLLEEMSTAVRSVMPRRLPTHIITGIILLYGVMIVQLIQENKKKIHSFYSYKSMELTLNWLMWLVFYYAGAMTLFSMLILLDVQMGRIMFPLINLLFIYGLSLYSLKQRALYENLSTDPELANEQEDAGGNEASKRVDPKLSTELDELMLNRKPYLNPTLRISDLATELNVTLHQLSYLLNSQYKKNFYHFINQYRIDLACQLLTDQDAKFKTILSIAYETGFNSKSTFNEVFKKITGQTPSAYRGNSI